MDKAGCGKKPLTLERPRGGGGGGQIDPPHRFFGPKI